MAKALVAGSTGCLGLFVVQEFKKQGYWVRALAQNPERLAETGPYLEPAIRDCVDEGMKNGSKAISAEGKFVSGYPVQC
jgi:nucleoside-diphosphate-sugar epimerase